MLDVPSVISCQWPLTLKNDRATWAYLKFGMRHRFSDMQQGGKYHSDMRHSLFLNSTCDIGENKRKGHATLPILKIDMRQWGPLIKGPMPGWISSRAQPESCPSWLIIILHRALPQHDISQAWDQVFLLGDSFSLL